LARGHNFRVEEYSVVSHGLGQATSRARAFFRVVALFWPLLLAPLLLLLPILGRFPYPSAEAAYSDLTISHYPNALYLLQALKDWGQMPLWSPTILGGYPFAANPLSGLWYPPGWLALLLPLPLGFNLVVALHLLWGGIGMYRLLRGEGLGHHAGLCGALAFAAMPKLFAHYGAGHLTLLYAVPWTPWLLWAWQQSGTSENEVRRLSAGDLLPGVVLGLVFLADVRWAVYAGALWWGWAFAHSHTRSLHKTLAGILRQTLFAALLAAPLALPLLEYTLLGSRAHLSAQEVLAFSLPVERLLGLFYPGIQGYHEWVIYPGALILLLALFAVVTASRAVRSHVRLWSGVAGLAILVSLGSQVPYFDFLAGLPGLELLRVPARALFLAGLALAALAAYGLDGLLAGSGSQETRRAGLALVALTSFTLALAGGVWLVAGELRASFAWGAATPLLGGLWIWIRIRRPDVQAPATWLAGLLIIGLLDLGGVDLQAFAGRSPQSVLAEGAAAAAYLADQPGMFRVYSPSYSLPQHTAARYRLELLDGVDPLHLERLAAFMEEASGVPRSGYSVSVPSFNPDEPEEARREYLPDPERLGWLNVAFVVAEYDLPVPGLVLRERFGETRLYENTFYRPRAWVQPLGDGSLATWRAAGAVTWTPNQITVTATGPGLLVLSEIAYPGWQVRVDGVLQELQVVDGLLRGVHLGPGEHTILFQYRPRMLLAGLGLSLAALLFLVARGLPRRASGRNRWKESGA